MPASARRRAHQGIDVHPIAPESPIVILVERDGDGRCPGRCLVVLHVHLPALLALEGLEHQEPAIVELLDDIMIENQQCSRQAEIYSNILASLMDARVSIVSNNLNILMKNLNAVVIAVAIPSFFAGVGGMSELAKITGVHDSRLAYGTFLLAMVFIGVLTFILIRRLEKH